VLTIKYSGKQKGTTIWWLFTETFNLVDEDPDPDGYDWMIKNASVVLDFSSFYS
jgi:hypothetical protein